MIYLASDHRGFLRKEEIKNWLKEEGHEVVDLGATELNPEDDEVDFVILAAEKIGEQDRGLFFCGSGVMVDVAANKFPHLRSCLAFDTSQVKEARNDDDVNVLAIAADFLDLESTKQLVEIFLATPFSNEERFTRRLAKLPKWK